MVCASADVAEAAVVSGAEGRVLVGAVGAVILSVAPNVGPGARHVCPTNEPSHCNALPRHRQAGPGGEVGRDKKWKR